MPLQPSAPCTLAALHKGERATVTGLAHRYRDGDGDGHEKPEVGSHPTDPAAQGLCQRLMALGFVAGESLQVVAESFPGRDPMAVRIGSSTFALRRREAQWVQVERQPS